MKPFHSALLIACVLTAVSTAASAGTIYIAPTSVSANAANNYGAPADLIDDAGSVSYLAPNPNQGGQGTSWHTSSSGSLPVTLSFDFGAPQSLDDIYIWDYYHHSPTDWTLTLFSGAGGSGSQLLDFDFSITPSVPGTSTKHIRDFTDVTGVLSGTLASGNNSGGGGVGLSEFGFTAAAAVPEPSTYAMATLGLLGLGLYGWRRRRA